MVESRELTFVEALKEALREEMGRDETVFIMGEDIRRGVYGASGGCSLSSEPTGCWIPLFLKPRSWAQRWERHRWVRVP